MLGLLDLKIKRKGVNVRLVGFGNRKFLNLKLLDIGLASVKARLAKHIGSDDAPTKPLTKRYARRKSKLTGRAAWRDLRLTGSFLDGFLPRYSDDNRAVAQPAGRLGRIKAVLYRDLINFSAADQRAMYRAAEEMLTVPFSQVFTPITSGAAPGTATAAARRQYERNRSTFLRAS